MDTYSGAEILLFCQIAMCGVCRRRRGIYWAPSSILLLQWLGWWWSLGKLWSVHDIPAVSGLVMGRMSACTDSQPAKLTKRGRMKCSAMLRRKSRQTAPLMGSLSWAAQKMGLVNSKSDLVQRLFLTRFVCNNLCQFMFFFLFIWSPFNDFSTN